MSFNAPFYSFFDAINNEVGNFNRALGTYGFGDYNRARRGLPYNNNSNNVNRGNQGRELQRRGNDNNAGVIANANYWDPWANDVDQDWGLLPADFANFGDFRITPPVDLLEHDKNYELDVTVPGLKNKNDVNINYYKDGNEIEISGEIPSVVNDENRGRVKRHEVASGSFRRVFSLPRYPGVDANHIKADYSGGVLKVDVPKLAPTAPKEGVHKVDVSSFKD